eukprot:gene26305-32250_t
MASKFKKQQRQKRYAESGIVFTSAYLDQVERLTASALVSFKAELAGFTKLTSTFKELEKHKVLLTSLLSLADAQCPHEDFLTALDVYWRLLLLSNSRPLHRQILSVLTRLPRAYLSTAQDSLVTLLSSTACTVFATPAAALRPGVPAWASFVSFSGAVVSIISYSPSVSVLQ